MHWHLASAKTGEWLTPRGLFGRSRHGKRDHAFPPLPDPEFRSRKETPRHCPVTLSAQSAKILFENGPGSLLFWYSRGLGEVFDINHAEKQPSDRRLIRLFEISGDQRRLVFRRFRTAGTLITTDYH